MMGFWLWQHRWAAYVVAVALALAAGAVLIAAAYWTAAVFMAVWTGDGVPAAWAEICTRWVPPWLEWNCPDVGIMGGLLGWWS